MRISMNTPQPTTMKPQVTFGKNEEGKQKPIRTVEDAFAEAANNPQQLELGKALTAEEAFVKDLSTKPYSEQFKWAWDRATRHTDYFVAEAPAGSPAGPQKQFLLDVLGQYGEYYDQLAWHQKLGKPLPSTVRRKVNRIHRDGLPPASW